MSIRINADASHRPTSETFGDNARAALGDEQLRAALDRAMAVFGERRHAAVAAVPDWEAMRDRARAVKDEVLLNLDRYLKEFVANAEVAGATVHWAREASEACEIVVELAAARGVRSVVKSKSMVTEEIHLNAAFAERGIEAVETDLGEYIVQLAGETPSHVVAPAIHKSRRDVAELFAATLGSDPLSDETALTRIAREKLRRRFSDAGMGISGVNFGVADTGTIAILENEGNARLTTTVPSVHVALMGIEKLIPRIADLALMLLVLSRSGSGQAITSYQSLITGVKRRRDDEGPSELHIVLLDNGRSRMLAHPVTRQSLACIRCGACLNVCPVYQQIGGHAYGTVYSGPIGAVISPQLMGLSKTSELPYASSLCGACREACPVKIDIPELLLHLRTEVVSGRSSTVDDDGQNRPPPRDAMERFAFRLFSIVMTRPWLMERSSGIGRFVLRMIPKGGSGGRFEGFLRRALPPLGAWTASRDMRPLAPQSFRDLWKASLAREAERLPRSGPDS